MFFNIILVLLIYSDLFEPEYNFILLLTFYLKTFFFGIW